MPNNQNSVIFDLLWDLESQLEEAGYSVDERAEWPSIKAGKEFLKLNPCLEVRSYSQGNSVVRNDRA